MRQVLNGAKPIDGSMDWSSDLRSGEWGGTITDVQVTMKGDTQQVPEPGTLLLLGSGLLVGAAFRKRFKP